MIYYFQSLNQQKFSLHIAKKLRELAHVLNHAHNHFKELSHKINDRKNQQIVYGLATEVYQYYNELISQIQMLECQPFEHEQEFNVEENSETKIKGKNLTIKDILAECSRVEFQIRKSYRELLNNSFIRGDLRNFLQNQFNGFLYSFVKLKMLDSLNVTIKKAGVRF